jgi:hypothetical protein
MIHRAIILAAILAAFGMRAAPTVTKAQQSHSQRNLAGLFVHTGVMELMTRGNERAIANVGFVIEADALVLTDTEAVFARFDAARQAGLAGYDREQRRASETSRFRFGLSASQIIECASCLLGRAELSAKVSAYLRHA